MNVLMFSNTFLPHVGGVTQSIVTLRAELAARGHQVMIIAPRYPGYRNDEAGVVRVPALDQVGDSGYAVPIPMSRHIRDEIEAFGPDLVHAHHPFLLGDTAMRTAASLGLPAVYTCHTRYDLYVRGGPDGRLAYAMRSLIDGFAGIADAVIAPSESIRAWLVSRGLETPVHVIPTGIDYAGLANGDGAALRQRLGFSPDDFVVGHVGRLSPEKNLGFLAAAISRLLLRNPRSRVGISGQGPERKMLESAFSEAIRDGRVRILDPLARDHLASFYAALDLFAFTSVSETQGLVVAEAMAAGTPVIALDAPGTRETIATSAGGILMPSDTSADQFADAMVGFAQLPPSERARRRRAARVDSARFSRDSMVAAIEALYAGLVDAAQPKSGANRAAWEKAWDGMAMQTELVENILHAAGVAVQGP